MTKDGGGSRGISPGLSNRLFFRLYQCANMLHKTGTRALDDYEITTQQWAVLGALTRPAFAEGVAVGDLAAFLLVTRQNLAGVLQRLEAMDYVERTVDANDNRSRLIRLTPKGRSLWDANMRPVIADYYDAALAGFSTEDRIHMIHYLDKMLTNFKALDPEASARHEEEVRAAAPAPTPRVRRVPSPRR
ncbi:MULTISPECIES: MarR family winged helix-turn-helix transcriptional regulator [Xanthobacter]|uniref:DNA-binding MarR family transcriptional regulator n=3 Tax=Xanthobacter flavus TaxID=281 RepID=A0ABU1KPK1_XANFL|nr:MarR family transcriptional regulator [Xanthobacter flavus]MDR6336552.1 DNA-binding MarR family transcriptional regulator [Xanthobacter flavus]UJX46241.1 MarR family transcriptional regulator [Xanthobacter sp. YC-JY1]